MLDWDSGDPDCSPYSAMKLTWVTLDQSWTLQPNLLHRVGYENQMESRLCKSPWVARGITARYKCCCCCFVLEKPVRGESLKGGRNETVLDGSGGALT